MTDARGVPAEPSEPVLDLRRRVIRGFAIGAVLAAAVFGFFALLPGTTRPIGLYVGLAVVLAVSVGLLATLTLVAVGAFRADRS